jgi:hypothetical protein
MRKGKEGKRSNNRFGGRGQVKLEVRKGGLRGRGGW